MFVCLPFRALFHRFWNSDLEFSSQIKAQTMVKSTQFSQYWVLFVQNWYVDGSGGTRLKFYGGIEGANYVAGILNLPKMVDFCIFFLLPGEQMVRAEPPTGGGGQIPPFRTLS